MQPSSFWVHDWSSLEKNPVDLVRALKHHATRQEMPPAAQCRPPGKTGRLFYPFPANATRHPVFLEQKLRRVLTRLLCRRRCSIVIIFIPGLLFRAVGVGRDLFIVFVCWKHAALGIQIKVMISRYCSHMNILIRW